MCNTIFACFCPSESINNKYDGAQSRRLLLQFYSLIRNLCWLWFSCSFRLFLLFLDPNHSFVFNRMVHTRTDIRQINKIWYILLGRMHINTGCRDWAVKDKERSYKVSQGTMHKNRFLQTSFTCVPTSWKCPPDSHPKKFKMVSKEHSVKRNTFTHIM